MASQKKKICFIVSTPVTANAFLLNHIKGLSDFFEVYLVANLDSSVQPNVTYLSGIHHLEIERKPNIFKDLFCVFRLFRYLRKNNFSAIHSVTPKAGLIAMLSSFFSGIPVRVHIFTGQVWHTRIGVGKLLLKLLDKLIARLSTHVLVDGKSQRDFLISNRIITKDKSVVLGAGSISGVNKSQFFIDTSIRDFYREKYKISADVVVFSFMGRLNCDKGILDLAFAFNKLNSKYNNIALFLIGFDEEHLKESIINQYNNDNIVFIDYTNEPFKILQMADVFCLPSYREGFGTSVIEASMLELPIICSDTYGLKETIIENRTGLRFEVGNRDELFSCMERLYLDSSMRINLGKNGRRYVLENFDADIITNEWVNFYKKLLVE